MATPHIAANENDFAKTVLMPGDPLRAKFIAEHYLENAKLVTSVRNIFGYTGFYKGVKVSVMASGMGMPSLAIYATELYKFYNVENIIRVGSCGGYQKEARLYDVILGEKIYTDSSWKERYNVGAKPLEINENLKLLVLKKANELNIPLIEGSFLSTDFFYQEENEWKKWANIGVTGVEMESYALYAISKQLQKNAISICTVSDSFVYEDSTTSTQREQSLTTMIDLALEVAISL